MDSDYYYSSNINTTTTIIPDDDDVVRTSVVPEDDNHDDSTDSNNDNKNDNNDIIISSSFDYNQFVQYEIPKVEFHVHLNGCIRSSTLFELASQRNVTLPSILQQVDEEFEEYEDFTKSSSSSSSSSSSIPKHQNNHHRRRTLQDCFDIFAILPSIITDLQALQRITYETLQDFAAHHTVYLELRSTPKRLLLVPPISLSSLSRNEAKNDNTNNNNNNDIQQQQQQATKRQYIETVLDVLLKFNTTEQERYQKEMEEYNQIQQQQQQQENRAKNNEEKSIIRKRLPRLPMVTRFIVSVDRSNSVAECCENINLAIDFLQRDDDDDDNNNNNQYYYKNLVVGIDLGGNPMKNDFYMYETEFQRARDCGLKITIHCAELPIHDNDDSDHNQQLYNEAQLIINFKPDRLGHAILLPPSLRQQLLHCRIPVETCPTSNVLTTNMMIMKSSDDDSCIAIADIIRTEHNLLQEWIINNYPIIICTDDPTVFSTTLTNEIILVWTAFSKQITFEHLLYNIILRSMDYAFCDTVTKHSIVQSMKHRFDTIYTERNQKQFLFLNKFDN